MICKADSTIRPFALPSRCMMLVDSPFTIHGMFPLTAHECFGRLFLGELPWRKLSLSRDSGRWTMLREIEQRKIDLQALCRQFGVRRLDLFGSAATESDLAARDLDFLVDLGELPPTEYAEAYFGLLEALEQMFSRPVDLVTAPSVRNPFFKQRLEQTRSMLYAA